MPGGVFGETAQLSLGIDLPELAALRQIADIVGIGPRLGEERIRQVEDLDEIAVPGRQPQLLVESDDTIGHIVEGDPQFRLALADFVQ